MVNLLIYTTIIINLYIYIMAYKEFLLTILESLDTFNDNSILDLCWY